MKSAEAAGSPAPAGLAAPQPSRTEPSTSTPSAMVAPPPDLPARLKAWCRTAWHLLTATAAEWSKDDVPVLGAALAFYTIFSLAPLLILFSVVVGYFLGREAVQADLVLRLGEYVGAANAQNLMHVVQQAYKPGSSLWATLIALGLILFGSTTVFLMLRNALDRMWGLPSAGGGLWGLVRDRGKSLLVVVGVGFLIFLAIVGRSLLAAFYDRLDQVLVLPGPVAGLLDYGFSLLFLTLLFTLLYTFLPSAPVGWRFAARGAVVSALLFLAGNKILGLYLTRQTLASAYGAAGSLVVLLLWVFYSAQIIFVGAEFTQVYARWQAQSQAPPPPPSAEPP